MSTTNTNYWSILGIKPGSDLDQIKRAFRKEARKWHPDLNINDINAEERFKLVNEAYAVLSDSTKRKQWEENSLPDDHSEDLFSNGFPSYYDYIELVLGINSSDDSVNSQEELNINNEDDQFSYTNNLNQKPTTSKKSPPPIKTNVDLETIVDISPEEALLGADVEVELADGSVVEVSTPPFSGDGWRLKLSGVALGGKDHFIQLRVQTEDGLRIDGLRVLYRLELFPHDALFGCAVDVPTLDGPVTLQVPPNSSSGRLLRLRGRGLQYDELQGDQIVEIVVVIPSDLNEAEIALYRRLQELAFE
mgnify:CR=1 FL=1